ncbi:MAG: hypothetical protein V4657_07650, partial [Pseudomonadota bacterium]
MHEHGILLMIIGGQQERTKKGSSQSYALHAFAMSGTAGDTKRENGGVERAPFLEGFAAKWCGWRDSNPHALSDNRF